MHEQHHKTATIASGEMTSEVIAIHQFNDALFQMPTGTEGVTLSYVGSTSPIGTFVAIVDSDGDAVTSRLTAASWQAVRSEVFGLPFIKLETTTFQAADRTITISGSSPRG